MCYSDIKADEVQLMLFNYFLNVFILKIKSDCHLSSQFLHHICSTIKTKFLNVYKCLAWSCSFDNQNRRTLLTEIAKIFSLWLLAYNSY